MKTEVKNLMLTLAVTLVAVAFLGPLPALAFFAAYPTVVQIMKDLKSDK